MIINLKIVDSFFDYLLRGEMLSYSDCVGCIDKLFLWWTNSTKDERIGVFISFDLIKYLNNYPLMTSAQPIYGPGVLECNLAIYKYLLYIAKDKNILSLPSTDLFIKDLDAF